ncbi:hypothetical protein [Bradyrhizobium sp. Arg816]|uniref:hypothetical protein n=1 Tax=Bradyrhizobium sp. Arg816 TaxID=2998491 RepID=UPI00249E9DB1|nr:hypothetical protein [Bradyrhizobium sp. Arg816]MDI3562574.1 hypothetical protein [Bradyrhizobium sp. Arg816]
MIKNVMVRLDGTRADDADWSPRRWPVSAAGSLPKATACPQPKRPGSLIRRAVSDELEAEPRQQLARLQKPVELRWFEALGDTMGEIFACETRTADIFVAMRPNGSSQEPEHLVECVLFGTELHSAVKRFPRIGSCRC